MVLSHRCHESMDSTPASSRGLGFATAGEQNPTAKTMYSRLPGHGRSRVGSGHDGMQRRANISPQTSRNLVWRWAILHLHWEARRQALASILGIRAGRALYPKHSWIVADRRFSRRVAEWMPICIYSYRTRVQLRGKLTLKATSERTSIRARSAAGEGVEGGLADSPGASES